MSNADVLAAVKSGELSIEDAGKLLAAAGTSQSRGPGRTIKTNKSGGLFVRDTAFKAWSENKQKHYTASVNIDKAVAKELFQLNKTGKPCELLREVCQYVQKNL